MIGIERIAEHVATLNHVVLAELFAACFLVVTTLAQRRELIERRVRLAAGVDRCAMIDHSGGLDAADL